MRCGLWERNVLHQRQGMCFAAGEVSRITVRPTLLWQQCASSSTRWEGKSFVSSRWWRRHPGICHRLCITESGRIWSAGGTQEPCPSIALSHSPDPWSCAPCPCVSCGWVLCSAGDTTVRIGLQEPLCQVKIGGKSPSKYGTQCNPLIQADHHLHLFLKDPF